MDDLDDWLDVTPSNTTLHVRAADAAKPLGLLQQYPPVLQLAVHEAMHTDSTCPQNQPCVRQGQLPTLAGRSDGCSTSLASAVAGCLTGTCDVLPEQVLQANPSQWFDTSINVAVKHTTVGVSAAAETMGWRTAHHASSTPAVAMLAVGPPSAAVAAEAATACTAEAAEALPQQMHKRQRLYHGTQQQQHDLQEDYCNITNQCQPRSIATAAVRNVHDTAGGQPHTTTASPIHDPGVNDEWLDSDWPGESRANTVQQLPGIFQRTARPTASEPDGRLQEHVQQQQHQQNIEEAEEEESTGHEGNILISADFDLSREQVIDRIEHLVHQLATSIAAGQLPELTCVSTAANNIVLAHPEAQQQDEDDGCHADGEGQQRCVLRLGSKLQKKTLLGSGGQQAYTIARVLQLLDVVHGLLKQGRTATQRDIYYTLLGPPFFNCQRDLTSTIQTTLSVLRVPRASLGITAAGKGAVAGRLLLHSRAGEAWQDCSLTGSAGRAIPGEIAAIQAMTLRPAGARFILVVEKDAVFQRLVEDRLFDGLPCILITGRGMPDMATRAFLAALAAAAGPSLPVLGLVDWNPSGVHILLSYKFGTAGLGLEAARYAVPHLCWLGINSDMLQDVPGSSCQALTQRDRALLPNLKTKLADLCPDWVSELEEMEETGLKADIEALYGVLGHQGLAEELSKRMLAQQYLA